MSSVVLSQYKYYRTYLLTWAIDLESLVVPTGNKVVIKAPASATLTELILEKHSTNAFSTKIPVTYKDSDNKGVNIRVKIKRCQKVLPKGDI